MDYERYKAGDEIRLTYNRFEKPQEIETTLISVSSQCPWGIELPLGANYKDKQGNISKYVSYYLLTDFAEKMYIKNDELIIER